MERRLKLFAVPRIAALDNGDACMLCLEIGLALDKLDICTTRLDEARTCRLANMVEEKVEEK